MKNFIEEFKAFALKGNVMELAVAVIIGAAFGKITTSLVNNIIMPLFGVVLGGIDFTDRMVTVGNAEVTYGVFVQSVIEFLLIALVLFFVIKSLTAMQRKEEKKPEQEKVLETPEDIKLLREIRDNLRQARSNS